MKAVTSFVKGFFTNHLGTKFLSLMLAALLFFFTEQSLSGTRTLREVTLSFQLDEKLRDQYVLLDDRVTLDDVTITGKIVEVDRAVRTLANSSDVVSVEVNGAFLESYGAGSVPIDKKFVQGLAILGEKVEPELSPGPTEVLRIARKKTVFLPPVLAAGQEAKLRLPPDHPYQTLGGDGDEIVVSFEPESVTVTGPESAFDDAVSGQSLKVVIPDLASYLRTAQPDATEIRLAVERIDWTASGIDMALSSHLRILAPQPMTRAEFEGSLLVTFRVEQRWKVGSVNPLPIEIGLPLGEALPEALNFIEAEDIKAFDSHWLEKGECKGFWISAPVSLWDAPDDLAQLALMLDYGNREEVRDDDSDSFTIFVPVRLWVKDPKRLELLRRAHIINKRGKPATNPRLRYDKIR